MLFLAARTLSKGDAGRILKNLVNEMNELQAQEEKIKEVVEKLLQE